MWAFQSLPEHEAALTEPYGDLSLSHSYLSLLTHSPHSQPLFHTSCHQAPLCNPFSLFNRRSQFLPAQQKEITF